MKTLNKKYRCIMPMDKNSVIKSEINSNNVPVLNHDDAVIFCDKGKTHISKVDRKTLCIYVFSTNMFNKIKQSMTDENIEILDSWSLNGNYLELDDETRKSTSNEGFIMFRRVDIDKVAKICKAKPQRKSKPVGLTDFKENYSYWLRIMRNVSDRYQADLNRWSKIRNSRNQKDGDNN